MFRERVEQSKQDLYDTLFSCIRCSDISNLICSYLKEPYLSWPEIVKHPLNLKRKTFPYFYCGQHDDYLQLKNGNILFFCCSQPSEAIQKRHGYSQRRDTCVEFDIHQEIFLPCAPRNYQQYPLLNRNDLTQNSNITELGKVELENGRIVHVLIDTFEDFSVEDLSTEDFSISVLVWNKEKFISRFSITSQGDLACAWGDVELLDSSTFNIHITDYDQPHELGCEIWKIDCDKQTITRDMKECKFSQCSAGMPDTTQPSIGGWIFPSIYTGSPHPSFETTASLHNQNIQYHAREPLFLRSTRKYGSDHIWEWTLIDNDKNSRTIGKAHTFIPLVDSRIMFLHENTLTLIEPLLFSNVSYKDS